MKKQLFPPIILIFTLLALTVLAYLEGLNRFNAKLEVLQAEINADEFVIDCERSFIHESRTNRSILLVETCDDLSFHQWIQEAWSVEKLQEFERSQAWKFQNYFSDRKICHLLGTNYPSFEVHSFEPIDN